MNMGAAAALFAFALLIGLAVSWSSLAQIMRIRRMPLNRISALPSAGTVAVTGSAGEKTILSPISKTPCAAYMIEVQEFKKTSNENDHTGFWQTQGKMRSAAPFELHDNTGTIQVCPSGSDFVISLAGEYHNLKVDQQAVIQEMGIEVVDFHGNAKEINVKEYLIRPGDEIFVMGQIQGVDGIKSIASVGDESFVISDQGQQSALNALYARVAKYLLISLAVAIAIILLGSGLIPISSGGRHKY